MKILKKKDMETITNGDARRIFDNVKKFYNAFRKINGVKIYQNDIICFLTQFEDNRQQLNFVNVNDFTILPFDLQTKYMTQCEKNEPKIMNIYERYLKEHVGHKFISFLKEQNALEEYIDNLNKQLNETLLYRILHHRYNYYINSFCWSETKQGYHYWRELDDMWHYIIYNETRNTEIQQSFYDEIKRLLQKYDYE